MKVPRIERGDPLSAAFFNQIVESVNELQATAKAVATASETLKSTASTEGTNVTPDNIGLINELIQSLEDLGLETLQEENAEDPPIELNFIETVRTTSTVRVEDPDDSEVYVDVDRIDGVSFVGANGEILRLVFTNG